MMIKQFQKTLFIFRRDLRLEDNLGLLFALKKSQTVIPSFIFTPEQVEDTTYRSDRCLQFMIESLQELGETLKTKKSNLYLFYGKPHEIVAECITKIAVDAIVVNRDYTPYSERRDQKILSVCKSLNVPFFSIDDALLHSTTELLKADDTPYTLFTPFYRKAMKLSVQAPMANLLSNYYSGQIAFAKKKSLFRTILPHKQKQQPGGRLAGLKILKKIRLFTHYEQIRDFPAELGTTHLSAHLKFTTISSREVYHAIVSQLGEESELIRALHWRDFFAYIAYYFPHVFKGAFHQKFDTLTWNLDKNCFRRWCEGNTGFPLVDAGMRELNQTGYMHNRVRMLTACFLIKDLHINWRWGERYFAQHLIDYDPAVNNGNWQWVAGTGADTMPYFRVFNPWVQSAKFDKECLYIKHWIPELSTLPAKIIHTWYVKDYHKLCPEYSPPVIEHTKEAELAVRMYKKII